MSDPGLYSRPYVNVQSHTRERVYSRPCAWSEGAQRFHLENTFVPPAGHARR